MRGLEQAAEKVIALPRTGDGGGGTDASYAAGVDVDAYIVETLKRKNVLGEEVVRSCDR